MWWFLLKLMMMPLSFLHLNSFPFCKGIAFCARID